MTRILVLNLMRSVLRGLPHFRGKGRLISAAKAYGASKPTVIVVTDFCGDAKFICDLSEHIASDIFWNGAYSTDQLWVLADVLNPKSVFMDIGANQGEFTVFAAKRAKQVFSVEPFEPVRRKLTDNLDANGFTNVEVIACALSDKEGQASLFTDPVRADKNGPNNSGVTSLVHSDVRNTKVGETRVTTLDALVQEKGLTRLDIIKIDVEGAEPAVLRGGLTTLRALKPLILIELNKEALTGAGSSVEEVLSLLGSLGYKGFLLNEKLEKRAITENSLIDFGNALFVPSRD